MELVVGAGRGAGGIMGGRYAGAGARVSGRGWKGCGTSEKRRSLCQWPALAGSGKYELTVSPSEGWHGRKK